jgi:hypothetical protein
MVMVIGEVERERRLAVILRMSRDSEFETNLRVFELQVVNWNDVSTAL